MQSIPLNIHSQIYKFKINKCGMYKLDGMQIYHKSCQKTTKFAERQPNLNSNIKCI